MFKPLLLFFVCNLPEVFDSLHYSQNYECIVVNPARMSGLRQIIKRHQRRRTRKFQSCVLKSYTANTNNYKCDLDFENQEEPIRLMTEKDCK